MALDAGIAALQLLYKLAKLIKETRDNVIFIRDKLEGTESISKLIELNLNRVDVTGCPEEIVQGIKTRFTQAKRTARKMKLKYEPLLQLVTSLGGNATLVKAQAAVMRKGVLGVTMAVGSVSVMLWRRVERTYQKLLNSIMEALRDCEIPVEEFKGLTLGQIIKKLKEPPVLQFAALASLDNMVAGTTHLLTEKSGQLKQVLHDKTGQLNAFISERTDHLKTALNEQVSDVLDNMKERSAQMNAVMMEKTVELGKAQVAATNWAHQKYSDVTDISSAKRQTSAVSETGQVEETKFNTAEKEVKEFQSSAENIFSEMRENYDHTTDRIGVSINDKSNLLHSAVQGIAAEFTESIQNTSEDITCTIQGEIDDGNAELSQRVHQMKDAINSTTNSIDDFRQQKTAQACNFIEDTSNQFRTAIAEKSDQLKSVMSHAIGNAMGGVLSDSLIGSTLSSGLNIAGNMISDKASRLLDQTLSDRPPSHLEKLEAKGYNLSHFELEFTGNEWLRSVLESMDQLNRELKALNADMKTYDVDDQEIDAGDDLVPELNATNNSRSRKSYIAEGINLLIHHWIPPIVSTKQDKEKDVEDVTTDEDENSYDEDEDQRVVTKHDLKKILGKGYSQSNLNLLWRFLKRTEEKLEQGEEFPKFGTSLAAMAEKPILLSMKSFSMKRFFSKSNLMEDNNNNIEDGNDKDDEENSSNSNTLSRSSTPKGKSLTSWMSFRSNNNISEQNNPLPEIKETLEDDNEDSRPISRDEAKSSSTSLLHQKLKPSALAVKSVVTMQNKSSSKKFGFGDFSTSSNTMNTEGDDEGAISLSVFRQFIQESSKRNLGLCLSALVLCLLKLVDHPKIPNMLKEPMQIIQQLLRPLIGYTGSFGILVAIEDVREIVHEDPDELLAMEAEADEEALQRRLELVKSFATDFQESFDNGFAPDPSLMMSIAIEVSTSFVGLGPSTKRRLALLQSIIGLTSIEDDKKKIDTVDSNMKAEIAVIQSLPRIEKDLYSEDARNRHSAQMEHMDLLRQEQAAAMKKHEEMIEILQDELKSNFDVRVILGEEGEASKFWTNHFGKECYEVHEKRFYAALIRSYDKLDEKEWKKLRAMLLDTRGMITAIHLQQFVGRDGSMMKVIEKLSKSNKLPRRLNEFQQQIQSPISAIDNSKRYRPNLQISISHEEFHPNQFHEKNLLTPTPKSTTNAATAATPVATISTSLPIIDQENNHKLLSHRNSKTPREHQYPAVSSSLPDIHPSGGGAHDIIATPTRLFHTSSVTSMDNTSSQHGSKQRALPSPKFSSPTNSSSILSGKKRPTSSCSSCGSSSEESIDDTPVMISKNQKQKSLPPWNDRLQEPSSSQRHDRRSYDSYAEIEKNHPAAAILAKQAIRSPPPVKSSVPQWNDRFGNSTKELEAPKASSPNRRRTYDSFTSWKDGHKNDKETYLQNKKSDLHHHQYQGNAIDRNIRTATERRQSRLRLYAPLMK